MTAQIASRRQVIQWSAAAAIGLALSNGWLLGDEPPKDAIAKMFSAKLEVTDLGGGLHLVANGGGNVLMGHAGDGILVVDTGMSFRAKDYLAVADSVAPGAKRKVVFNTHWHMDHTGGNADFAADNVIAGSEACRARMGEAITNEDMGRTTEPLPESARPVITFAESMDIVQGTAGHVLKFAPAHTDTDAIIVFHKEGIVHTGDLHFNGGFPVIDRSTKGSLDGMIAATKRLLEMVDDKTRVIPGHGPLASKVTLTAQLELLSLTHDRLSPLGEKKMTMDEVVAKAPLADQDDKWGRGFLRLPMYTRMAYGQWVTKGK